MDCGEATDGGDTCEVDEEGYDEGIDDCEPPTRSRGVATVCFVCATGVEDGGDGIEVEYVVAG